MELAALAKAKMREYNRVNNQAVINLDENRKNMDKSAWKYINFLVFNRIEQERVFNKFDQ